MRTNPTTSRPGVSTSEEKSTGRIDQIIGPVLDVTFPPGKLPYIYNALVVQSRDTVDKQINVTCEVQQLLGNNRIRLREKPLFIDRIPQKVGYSWVMRLAKPDMMP